MRKKSTSIENAASPVKDMHPLVEILMSKYFPCKHLDIGFFSLISIGNFSSGKVDNV